MADTFSTDIPQPGKVPIFDLNFAVWHKYVRGENSAAADLAYKLRQRAFACAVKHKKEGSRH